MFKNEISHFLNLWNVVLQYPFNSNTKKNKNLKGSRDQFCIQKVRKQARVGIRDLQVYPYF